MFALYDIKLDPMGAQQPRRLLQTSTTQAEVEQSGILASTGSETKFDVWWLNDLGINKVYIGSCQNGILSRSSIGEELAKQT